MTMIGNAAAAKSAVMPTMPKKQKTPAMATAVRSAESVMGVTLGVTAGAVMAGDTVMAGVTVAAAGE